MRSPKYDLLALGKDVAGNLGLNVDKTYLEALLMAGFMIGGAISIGGIFPFLGLVLPFIVRIFIGPSLMTLIANYMQLCCMYNISGRLSFSKYYLP